AHAHAHEEREHRRTAHVRQALRRSDRAALDESRKHRDLLAAGEHVRHEENCIYECVATQGLSSTPVLSRTITTPTARLTMDVQQADNGRHGGEATEVQGRAKRG